jgi:hypothetical protein
MADKIPKVISNATVIKVLAKVFAFQAIEINLLRLHAGISDANWKALKTEAFKKTYAKQRSFYEDRLTGAFALERISQSERETRLLELWLKQSEDSPKAEPVLYQEEASLQVEICPKKDDVALLVVISLGYNSPQTPAS